MSDTEPQSNDKFFADFDLDANAYNIRDPRAVEDANANSKLYGFAYTDADGNAHALVGAYRYAESKYDPDSGILSVTFYESEGEQFVLPRGDGRKP